MMEEDDSDSDSPVVLQDSATEEQEEPVLRLNQDFEYSQEDSQYSQDEVEEVPAPVATTTTATAVAPSPGQQLEIMQQRLQQMPFHQQQQVVQQSWTNFQPPNPVNWMQQLRAAENLAAHHPPPLPP